VKHGLVHAGGRGLASVRCARQPGVVQAG
jgi:hypothetical protein